MSCKESLDIIIQHLIRNVQDLDSHIRVVHNYNLHNKKPLIYVAAVFLFVCLFFPFCLSFFSFSVGISFRLHQEGARESPKHGISSVYVWNTHFV